MIKKLSEDTINKIAAGEVVERPASVVKELIDNALDAKATQIKIWLSEGGKKLIQVEDNGCGIVPEELRLAFAPHSTSKISSIDDLNKLITMGFRGEALSTIQSVSKVKILSKTKENQDAYQLDLTTLESFKPQKAAGLDGTTVTVSELFYNVPARLRFLRQEQTEYRKILELLQSYFIINPGVKFELYKDGKQVIKLSNSSFIDRAKAVLEADWIDDSYEINTEIDGVKIFGIIAQPHYHNRKVAHQYIFINNRPITDHAIAKSVSLGYEGYIPENDRIPFIISLSVRSDLVDVNVHPRKEEVAFLNPFRVYNAVTQAVAHIVKSNKNYQETSSFFDINKPRTGSGFLAESPNDAYKVSKKSGFNDNYKYPKSNTASVQAGLKFSEAVMMQDKNFDQVKYDKSSQTEFSDTEKEKLTQPINYLQIFYKFVLIEFADKILVVDQHAAAERVTFERLMQRDNKLEIVSQKLLIPLKLSFDGSRVEYIREQIEFFREIGFDIEFKNKEAIILQVPADFVGADFEKMFTEIISDESKEPFARRKTDIIATMACHTSIRTGQKLVFDEIKSLWASLIRCENPYSCPHGRPIVWEIKLSDLDSKFER